LATTSTRPRIIMFTNCIFKFVWIYLKIEIRSFKSRNVNKFTCSNNFFNLLSWFKELKSWHCTNSTLTCNCLLRMVMRFIMFFFFVFFSNLLKTHSIFININFKKQSFGIFWTKFFKFRSNHFARSTPSIIKYQKKRKETFLVTRNK